MRTILLSLLLAVPLSAADPVEEVRQAEIAFAKAFADRDQTRFFAMVADDATFLPGGRTLHGKAEVMKVWSGYFKDAAAPFSWGPERVVVSADGKLGLSTGPIYDAKGKPAGAYISTWRREPDGSWKVVFDGPGAPPPFMPEDAPKIEEGFVTAPDGVKLHYRKIGSAPRTVIVPLGFILFDEVKQLSDAATVITYDMRNRGRSQKLTDLSSATIQQDVKDLEAVRAHFKVDRFVPIGYSYLGMMVGLYAMEYPQHVTRIVQIGPVAPEFGRKYPAGMSEPQDSLEAPPEVVKRWMDMRKQPDADPRAFCEAQETVFSYLLVGNPAHHTRVRANCHLENELPANMARQMETHWGSVKKIALTDEDLQKIKVPVLTIHGTRDRNAPYGGGREWAARLPDARLITVPGAAHAVFLEEPVVVWGSIRQFLRGEWPLGAEDL
ncbi:MAG TPA: alpha/beta fold hydrolase [Thermoanaerobaculia bacterium]|nr:alpha/beta fold hydrolase [Thermoanaerobaculia bacterium]